MFIFRSFVLKQQARTLCWTKARLDRFTRDSLRNRLHRQNVRDGTKQRLTQSEHHAPPSAADTIPIRPVRDLIKAIGFTLGIGTAAFSTAAICDYERTRSRLKNVYENTADFFKTKFSSSEDSFRTLWSELTDGDKCALYLVGINFAVFALWKAKGLQVFMWQYFSNSFASRSLCLPMALSVFSHSSLIHLALNMYVVWSFTNVTVDKFMGPDQFWAFFVTAGVVSSLVSLTHKAITRSSIRALGASGAILGVLAYTCMKIPDARLKIVFVPGFDFSAQSAIIGIILFDVLGLLFRFRLFDHSAHLGGSLFGVFYALWGDDIIWNKFRSLVGKTYRRLKSE